MRTAVIASLAVIATVLAGCSHQGTPTTSVPCADLISQADLSDDAHTVIEITTSKGSFKAELFDDKTPITVENFKGYASSGFFDGTLFHRIILDFMIQGGGMDAESGQMKSPTQDPIKNEARASGCTNLEYTLAMARTTQPDSATNQFFVNTKDNCFLDAREHSSCPENAQEAGYAAFGVVVEGRDVVDAIENTSTTTYDPNRKCQDDGSKSCPLEEVVIQSVKVI